MAEPKSQSSASRVVECLVPVLRVSDLKASLQFYRDTLGFTKDWGADESSPEIASVSRDALSIMLSQGERGGRESWIWIGVEDIAPLYEQLVELGVSILQPPTNRSWAFEMKVCDPDGHVLWFGSEPVAES